MQACVVTINVNEAVDDLVDLVEYAFGPASLTWGARRVSDGHEHPYKPFIIEIGNESAALDFIQALTFRAPKP